MSLNVLRPITIDTNPQLISSSAIESGDVTWSSGTTYALGNTVKLNHVRYESLQGTNLNKDPAAINSTWWLELGPTNQWAMFDSQTSTATTATGSLVVNIKPGTTFNGGAVIGITGAKSVLFEVFQGASRDVSTRLYSVTKNLDNTFISGWYQYLFEPYEVLTDLLFGALESETAAGGFPPYYSAEVRVTITGNTPATVVGCAGILIGAVVELGVVQSGATSGIKDYSIKETDTFGVTTLVQRSFAKRSSYTLWVPISQLRRVHSTLSALRAVPCVWVASTEYELSPLTVYGVYKDFNILVNYVDYCTCSIEIEGLT